MPCAATLVEILAPVLDRQVYREVRPEKTHKQAPEIDRSSLFKGGLLILKKI